VRRRTESLSEAVCCHLPPPVAGARQAFSDLCHTSLPLSGNARFVSVQSSADQGEAVGPPPWAAAAQPRPVAEGLSGVCKRLSYLT